MLKFRGGSSAGRPLVGVGLTQGNIDRLRLGQPVKVSLEEWDPTLHAELVIAYAESPIRIVEQLGATGKHPYGKIHPEDEGELRFQVGSDRETETVAIDFGKPTHWIGMRPEQAEAFARLIQEHAKRARR